MSDKTRIYEGARVVGDVTLSDKVGIWYNAVVRGDEAPISIGERSNVQDNCVVHVSTGKPVNIGKGVSIGHGAIIHGCTIDDNVIIGMGAIVLNGAHIQKNSLVGAGALVTENKEFPEGSLIIGSPAKAVRQLTDEEIKSLTDNADEYVELAFGEEE